MLPTSFHVEAVKMTLSSVSAFTATNELYLNQIIEGVKDEAKWGKQINIHNDPAFRYNTNLFFQFIEESHRHAVNCEKQKEGLAARIVAGVQSFFEAASRRRM